MKQKDDVDFPIEGSLIEALRGDLPSSAQEERVRARLIAAGVMLTTTAVTSAAAAAAAAAGAGTSGAAAGAGASTLAGGASAAPAALAQAGLWSKVVAFPVAAKIGVATVAVGVAASTVPALMERAGPPVSSVTATAAPPQVARSSERVGAPRGALHREQAAAVLPEARALAELPSDAEERRTMTFSSDAAGAKKSAPAPAVPQAKALTTASAPTASAPTASAPSSGAQSSGAQSSGAQSSGAQSSRAQRGTAVPLARAVEPSSAEASGDVVVTSTGVLGDSAAVGGTRAASSASSDATDSEAPRPSVAAVPSTLAEEAALMERAMAALARDDRTAAQHWLGEHAKRFPSGVLARERMRALARATR